MSKLTPMMQQYVNIKKEYPDSILMYRLGDFYEMFFEDAKIAARELELALTARDCGLEERAPMCGIPHHSAEPRMTALVEKGYKVVVVDQMEDPKYAKGLVKRAVTRIITPGTLTDVDSLDGRTNNYLMSIFEYKDVYAFALLDLSTGDFKVGKVEHERDNLRVMINWIARLEPSEVLYCGEKKPLLEDFLESKNIFITLWESEETTSERRDFIKEKMATGIQTLQEDIYLLNASSNLFSYIYRFREENLTHIKAPEVLETEEYLKIDVNTRENLELHENLQDRTRKNSLLWAIDRTKTSMGARKLNSWLELPLVDVSKIRHRQDYIEGLYDDLVLRTELEELLSNVYDIERLLSKISYRRANGKDLIALKLSISNLPGIRDALANSQELFQEFAKHLDTLEDLYQLIDASIVEDPPVLITEGELIKKGFDEKLDSMRESKILGRKKLIEYEASEREKTQIKNLRVDFNKNTGYYIEITKSNLDKVPDHYIRRQTLKNSERYMTPELDEIASMILGGEEQIKEKEYEIFQDIRSKIESQTLRIQKTVDMISDLDVYCSAAKIAMEYDYVRPVFWEDPQIVIREGRHPVVERKTEEPFIPNDLTIGAKDDLIHIITGPNMAGKSTYMRQVALILILAHMGFFVPAKSCELPVLDAIYTRIGASDNLAKGDSTFMVEMKEMSYIISNATEHSFIVLDEVGRGTSTEDGLSIALAIVEYLSEHIQAKTLFATHYHELTQLADRLDNVQNRKVEIEEKDGELIFLRKIHPGRAHRSYGIEVAQLSGLPKTIIERAFFLLGKIDNKTKEVMESEAKEVRQENFDDFQKTRFLQEIANLDLNRMNPMEAFQALYRFHEEAKKWL